MGGATDLPSLLLPGYSLLAGKPNGLQDALLPGTSIFTAKTSVKPLPAPTTVLAQPDDALVADATARQQRRQVSMESAIAASSGNAGATDKLGGGLT